MGVRIGEDARGCARGNHQLEDGAVARRARAGVELAIGEGAGAAQAKLDVALRVEWAALGKRADDGASPRGIVATLDEQRLEAGLGERERAEESPLDEGARRRLLDEAQLHPAASPRASRDLTLRSLTAAERRPRGEHEVHVLALSRVNRALAQLERGDVVLGDAQGMRDGREQGLALALRGPVKPGEAEREVRDLDHRAAARAAAAPVRMPESHAQERL